MHRVRLLRYLNSWSPARLDDRQINRGSAFHDYPFYLAHCLLRAAVGNLVAQAFHRISIEADQIQIASGAVGQAPSDPAIAANNNGRRARQGDASDAAPISARIEINE